MRQVYGWFLHLYQISVAAGLCGYLLLILEVFGVGLLLRPIGVPATLSLLMVWCAAVPISFSAFRTMAQVLPRHLAPSPTVPLVCPGLLAKWAFAEPRQPVWSCEAVVSGLASFLSAQLSS